MPQLPSGRHVGIMCQSNDNLIKKYSSLHPEVNLLNLGIAIAHIDSLDEIKPFINVLFMRETNDAAPEVVEDGSLPIPPGLESFDSGYTLADLDRLTEDWSDEDKVAFADFLAAERTVKYFHEVLNLMPKVGADYGKRFTGWMNDICGVPDESEDDITKYDDYDLLVALCIYADMSEPEGKHPLDLWYRMNAMRRYWEEWIPVLAYVNKSIVVSPMEIASDLRERLALNACPEDKREWLHQQNVVFANDLFDIYEPEVLTALNQSAYKIVKYFALSEPTR